MVEGASNAQSGALLVRVCVCVHMCVHALPFDQPPQAVQPHKTAQSCTLKHVFCPGISVSVWFLCMLVSGREGMTIEWACANRTGEHYKVALYLACGRVKNAVIVCLETQNICLADAQTSSSATEVL